MTLTPYEAPPSAGVAVRDYQSAATARLAQWAESATAAFGIAERLVQTSFVPAAFRGKPVEAAAAILAGVEVGLQPMAALRSFDVISGQAAPRAITLRAIALSFGHEVELVESTATRCKMRGRRRGSSEWQTVTWTIERARDLGLTGKDSWKKQPIAMLHARATSELTRLIAADAILGLGYSAEEVQDGADDRGVEAPTGAVAVTTTRTMSRKPAPAPEPEPEDVEPEPEPGITQPQLKALHAALNGAGITERDEALAYYAATIGHDVASSKDLTKSEASWVIDSLQPRGDVEPLWTEGGAS